MEYTTGRGLGIACNTLRMLVFLKRVFTPDFEMREYFCFHKKSRGVLLTANKHDMQVDIITPPFHDDANFLYRKPLASAIYFQNIIHHKMIDIRICITSHLQNYTLLE
jgi:hypothetical protein